jgi:heme oxygenase
MEEEIGKLCENSHPVISPIGFKELARKENLEQDLSFYFGSNWSELVKPSKPAIEYEARIREIAKDNPALLIGHHYSRYIGDLSGGQLLKTITKKAMNLPDDEGLSFYIFEEIKDEKEFKIKYRNTLDNLPIDQKLADSIIEEANRSFKYNMDIFNELEGNLIAAIGKVLFRFFANKKRKGSTE